MSMLLILWSSNQIFKFYSKVIKFKLLNQCEIYRASPSFSISRLLWSFSLMWIALNWYLATSSSSNIGFLAKLHVHIILIIFNFNLDTTGILSHILVFRAYWYLLNMYDGPLLPNLEEIKIVLMLVSPWMLVL